MQPWEALEPIEASSEVPWMPTPSKMPSQRALIGLLGSSPAMTLPASLPAHALLGTCQAGLMALLAIVYWPAGVSRPTCPTAMP